MINSEELKEVNRASIAWSYLDIKESDTSVIRVQKSNEKDTGMEK